MGRQSGIYQEHKSGQWRVDRVHRGERIQGRFATHEEALTWLTTRLASINAHGTLKNRSMTLAEAATRYLLEEEAAGRKLSLATEAHMLAPVVELCGTLQLHQVHDRTLKPFVDARLAAGRAAKTINLSLSIVQHMLNIAHDKWRVNIGGGQDAPLLVHVPRLTKRPLVGQQRTPRPLSWDEQAQLLPKLPAHLRNMALFALNTGLRDDVICRLRWDWEIDDITVMGRKVSVFEVPFDPAQVRKKSKREFDYVVCNSAAQAVIEGQRGLHDAFVFVWRRERTSQDKYQLRRHALQQPMPWRPVATMNNTAWQSARRAAGLDDLHVHDLRHTVGQRLRAAGVLERTISDVLWHQSANVTQHYSVAQVTEIWAALEHLATRPIGQQNHSLRGRSKAAQRARVPSESLQQPLQKKTG